LLGMATKSPVVKGKKNGTNCLTALAQMIVVARRTRLILYTVKQSVLNQVIEPRCQRSTRDSQDAMKVFELGHPSQGKPQNEESPAVSDDDRGHKMSPRKPTRGQRRSAQYLEQPFCVRKTDILIQFRTGRIGGLFCVLDRAVKKSVDSALAADGPKPAP